ncbi:MFS transporter [Paenibacillus jilunlii]|uniref:MFS transporter n=1 Tax=Paenibacillus jilunlii TaxID=682956 RepID=A0A1G9KQ32_9BACL|nr:MFS transporter [Paenibacillus jilunlii]KWX69860.1 MFS transporter [Paenibacillus jilunlii]SDL51822.1 Predicted arabinose efflux permease, MFS family [Paenibacillus jilunlii]
MNRQEKSTTAPSLLRNRFLQTILLSSVLLQIGIWVRNFAILLYVADKTNNDPYAISLISVAEFAPIFVFSFIGGTFADRWRPKRTMIWCDLLSAVSVFAVLLTIHYGSWHSVYLVAFISAILSQFSQPSSMRLFKYHVAEEQLQQGMALFQSLMAIFMVLGPMLGTFVYSTFGLETSIAIMGVVFLLSALVLIRLPEDNLKPKTDAAKGQFRKEFIEGFRYVWNSKVLRMLGLAFILAGLAVGVAQALNLFIVTERLGKSKEFLQYLLMVNGAAMLIGGGVVAVFAKRVPPQLLLAIGMLAGAVCTVIVGYSTSVPLTLTVQFLNGLVFPCIHIGISTMILKWSHSSIVGRVNGVLNPMFVGMMVISMSFAGALKDAFSLSTIYSGAGLLFLLGALVMLPIMNQKAPDHAHAAQET